MRALVNSNSFKAFNGCIVEFLNFIGPLAKKLEHFFFQKKVLSGQSSSKCLGLSVCTVIMSKGLGLSVKTEIVSKCLSLSVYTVIVSTL